MLSGENSYCLDSRVNFAMKSALLLILWILVLRAIFCLLTPTAQFLLHSPHSIGIPFPSSCVGHLGPWYHVGGRHTVLRCPLYQYGNWQAMLSTVKHSFWVSEIKFDELCTTFICSTNAYLFLPRQDTFRCMGANPSVNLNSGSLASHTTCLRLYRPNKWSSSQGVSRRNHKYRRWFLESPLTAHWVRKWAVFLKW